MQEATPGGEQWKRQYRNPIFPGSDERGKLHLSDVEIERWELSGSLVRAHGRFRLENHAPRSNLAIEQRPRKQRGIDNQRQDQLGHQFFTWNGLTHPPPPRSFWWRPRISGLSGGRSESSLTRRSASRSRLASVRAILKRIWKAVGVRVFSIS